MISWREAAALVLDHAAPPRLTVYKEPEGWEWTVLRPVVGKPWHRVAIDSDTATTHAEALAVGLAALEAASLMSPDQVYSYS